jgi:hypothetical protein
LTYLTIFLFSLSARLPSEDIPSSSAQNQRPSTTGRISSRAATNNSEEEQRRQQHYSMEDAPSPAGGSQPRQSPRASTAAAGCLFGRRREGEGTGHFQLARMGSGGSWSPGAQGKGMDAALIGPDICPKGLCHRRHRYFGISPRFALCPHKLVCSLPSLQANINNNVFCPRPRLPPLSPPHRLRLCQPFPANSRLPPPLLHLPVNPPANRAGFPRQCGCAESRQPVGSQPPSNTASSNPIGLTPHPMMS